MKVSEIYKYLEEIHCMVERNAKPDGTIDINETMAGIVLEYAVQQIRKAIELVKRANLNSSN